MSKLDRQRDRLNAPYFLHKDADYAEEVIRKARGEGTNLGVNSMLLFFPLAHPKKADEWNRRYAHYIKRAKRLLDEASSDHIGWNDHWMCKWLILGDPECLPKLYAQTQRTNIWAPPGHHPDPDSWSVGRYAVWMTDSMSMQCDEFRKVWHQYVKLVDPKMAEESPVPWVDVGEHGPC